MATHRELRKIALSLPGTSESTGRLGYSVRNKAKDKGFVWSWKERIDPKKARVENRDVLAVRTASLSDKELLLASDETKYFTEPHYNGYPAVLIRLAAIGVDELEVVVTAAWRCQAPKDLVTEFDTRPAKRVRKRAPAKKKRR